MTSEETEGNYDLKKSRLRIGELVPCILDKDGKLVDGFHRKKIDPSWWEIKNPKIDSPVKREIAALVINFHRRDMDFQEKRDKVGRIAELSGWNAKEIADNIGMSLPWVYRHLPTKFKKSFVREYTRTSTILDPRNTHEHVKNDRVSDSKALARFLKDASPTPREDKFEGAMQQMEDPTLPYPDCLCVKCDHYEKCWKQKPHGR